MEAGLAVVEEHTLALVEVMAGRLVDVLLEVAVALEATQAMVVLVE